MSITFFWRWLSIMTYLSFDLHDMVSFILRTPKSVMDYLHNSWNVDVPIVYEYVPPLAFDIPNADRKPN